MRKVISGAEFEIRREKLLPSRRTVYMLFGEISGYFYVFLDDEQYGRCSTWPRSDDIFNECVDKYSSAVYVMDDICCG